MKAIATVISINVMFRSVFLCRCNLLRVDADINGDSLLAKLFVGIIERCIGAL